jgi:hypothetical protein
LRTGTPWKFADLQLRMSPRNCDLWTNNKNLRAHLGIFYLCLFEAEV